MKVLLRYYTTNLLFLRVDLHLISQYLLQSPHRYSRAFLKEKGESNIYAYGETPLTTMDLIAKECRILSSDVVFELGCGSGRGCFWLNLFVKCRVVGLDFLPQFIEKARKVKQSARLLTIDFLQQDMLIAPLDRASVIYLYGTCLEDETILALVERFKTLPAGTKIITVSYPLTEYCSTPHFLTEKEFSAPFPWGKAQVFLNVIQRQGST